MSESLRVAMIGRRTWLRGSCSGVLVAWLTVHALPKVRRVGILWVPSESVVRPSAVWDSFRVALQEKGWTEGREVLFEHRYADGDQERFPALSRDLVAAGVDVIVASGGAAALAAAAETSTIPIVFAAAPDPDLYLVPNLARPGGNVTGVGSLSTSLIGKRLELLKQAFPGISRVGMLPFTTAGEWKLPIKTVREWNASAYRLASKLGLELVAADVQRRGDLAQAVAAVARPDAWFVQDEVLYLGNVGTVVEVLTAQRKPAIYPHTAFVRAGGLMSLATDLKDQVQRAASFVDRILRGALPGDLPVEMPTTFSLAIHRGTARKLGLAIPQGVLLRANELIE